MGLDLLRIFIASPSDVSHLRIEAELVIKKLSKLFSNSLQVKIWLWERDKKPEYLDDPSKYQKHIFKEFGKKIDIMILIVWTKIGEGTKEEYDKYVNEFRITNRNCEFIVFWYQEPVRPVDIDVDELAKLKSWIKSEEEKWAPLGKVRNSINSIEEFKEQLESSVHAIFLIRHDKKLKKDIKPKRKPTSKTP